MDTFNSITSAFFDIVLAPFGSGSSWAAIVDIVLWSVLAGIVALIGYKYLSFQKAIASIKNQIKVHLLEIRLYKDDILGVLVATGKIVLKNLMYIGNALVPMTVLLVPMLAIAVQLVSWYAYDPLPEGAVRILSMQLDAETTDVAPTDVRLELPPGVALDAPPVRTAQGAVAWRIRTETAGDHTLTVHVGDEAVTKGVAVGGGGRKIPVKRVKGLEAFLYPGEPALSSSSQVSSVGLSYPTRRIEWMPDGEFGILAAFLLLSLVAGFALKGVFGVTL